MLQRTPWVDFKHFHLDLTSLVGLDSGKTPDPGLTWVRPKFFQVFHQWATFCNKWCWRLNLRPNHNIFLLLLFTNVQTSLFTRWPVKRLQMKTWGLDQGPSAPPILLGGHTTIRRSLSCALPRCSHVPLFNHRHSFKCLLHTLPACFILIGGGVSLFLLDLLYQIACVSRNNQCKSVNLF